MNRIAYILLILAFTTACTQSKTLSSSEASDSEGMVGQVCRISFETTSEARIGVVKETLNLNTGGLFEIVNGLAPEIAEEIMLKEGDKLELKGVSFDRAPNEEFVLKVGCLKDECHMLDKDFHQISNYVIGDSLIVRDINCLGKEGMTVIIELRSLASSKCSKQELDMSLMRDFDWFDNRIGKLKDEIRKIAGQNDRKEVDQVLEERNEDLMNLIDLDGDCLSISNVELRLK